MWKFALAVLCLGSTLHARPSSGYYTNPDVDELRVEIDDLKYALNTAQVELGLLQERLKKQDQSFSSIKETVSSTTLEKKVLQLEKVLDKAVSDLRTLSQSVNQTLSKIQNLESGITEHDKRFDEVTKLKGTLTSISKAIKAPEAPSQPTKTYRVKAGDSLEKIARSHQLSVETLRKINNLSNDKILVGQELRVANE